MSVSICAINSKELNDQELINDGFNLFVYWELSDMFSDVLISRDTATGNEPGELDQIGLEYKIDIEPIFKMSNYWDKEQEIKHLALLHDDAAKAKQLAIITQNNNNLHGNIQLIEQTMHLLESKVQQLEVKAFISRTNAEFYDNNAYFSNNKKTYRANFLEDIKKINEFIAFAKPLDADTLYFKFKTNS